MVDWTRSMAQTFEFYKVDVNTWRDTDLVRTISSCDITRDESNLTLQHATFNCSDYLDEGYLRVYLKVLQDNLVSRFPLGTFLVQTPSLSFDGKKHVINIDAYSPLIELKDDYPPLGYALLKDTNIMDSAYRICKDNSRAIINNTPSDKTLFSDFVANTNDSWLSFVKDLIPQANYSLALDENGTVLFNPITDISSLQPVWIFSDNNSSILHPSIKDNRDLFGVPNVIEVIYSSDGTKLYSTVVNDDPSSPISTVNRGRRVTHRDTKPSIVGKPTQEYLDEYAKKRLRELSSLEHRITFSHGYCPVRVGDCVMLDYKRSGIRNVKGKVVSQNIKCSTGCTVETTIVYTDRLWR